MSGIQEQHEKAKIERQIKDLLHQESSHESEALDCLCGASLEREIRNLLRRKREELQRRLLSLEKERAI